VCRLSRAGVVLARSRHSSNRGLLLILGLVVKNSLSDGKSFSVFFSTIIAAGESYISFSYLPMPVSSNTSTLFPSASSAASETGPATYFLAASYTLWLYHLVSGTKCFVDLRFAFPMLHGSWADNAAASMRLAIREGEQQTVAATTRQKYNCLFHYGQNPQSDSFKISPAGVSTRCQRRTPSDAREHIAVAESCEHRVRNGFVVTSAQKRAAIFLNRDKASGPKRNQLAPVHRSEKNDCGAVTRGNGAIEVPAQRGC